MQTTSKDNKYSRNPKTPFRVFPKLKQWQTTTFAEETLNSWVETALQLSSNSNSSKGEILPSSKEMARMAVCLNLVDLIKNLPITSIQWAILKTLMKKGILIKWIME